MALARLTLRPGGPPLLAAVIGSCAGEGFDCQALDTLFLAAPVTGKGGPVQHVCRVLRSHDGKSTAEGHDCDDELSGILRASLLAKRAPGSLELGFPRFAARRRRS